MSNPERVTTLHERLTAARNAKNAVSQSSWEAAWAAAENEYIERAIECGPDELQNCYILLQVVKATRRARRVIEHESQTIAGLETELAFLTGEKKPAIV